MNENEINTNVVENVGVEAPTNQNPINGYTPINNVAGENAPVIENNEKNKKSKLPIVIILVLVLVAVCGCLYYTLIMNPKNAVTSLTNNLFKKAISTIDAVDDMSSFDIKKQTIEESGDISFDISVKGEGLDPSITKIIDDVKNYKFSYDAVVNIPKNELSFELGLNNKEKTLISINSFLKDKKIYAKAKEILDKIIYIDAEALDMNVLDNIEELKLTDIKELIEKTNKYVNNSIKKDYISQKYGKHTIKDQGEITGFKNTLKLDLKAKKEIGTSIITSIKNDSRYIEIFSKISQSSKEEITQMLEQSLKEITATNDSKEVQYINVYTSLIGGFEGIELLDNDNVILSGIKKDNKTTIKLFEAGKELATIIISDGKTEVKIEKVSLVFESKKDEIIARLEYEPIKVELDTKIDSKKGETKTNTVISVNYKENENEINAKINLNTNTKEVKEIKTFDTNKAISVDELTEDDLTNALTKIQNNFKGTIFESIIELASMLSLQSPSEYDNPYDSNVSSSDRRSFELYVTNISNAAQTEFLYDAAAEYIKEPGYYVYDIKKDLDLLSTGDYEGYVVVDATNFDEPHYIIFLHNSYYMIVNYNITIEGMIDSNDRNVLSYIPSLYETYTKEEDVCGAVTTGSCKKKDGSIITARSY